MSTCSWADCWSKQRGLYVAGMAMQLRQAQEAQQVAWCSQAGYWLRQQGCVKQQALVVPKLTCTSGCMRVATGIASVSCWATHHLHVVDSKADHVLLQPMTSVLELLHERLHGGQEGEGAQRH
jgi:hypothetical protein